MTAPATAVWFRAPLTVERREESLPPTGAGQVRVRTVASGVSHGTEMLVYRGQIPTGLELDLPTLAGSFDFPIKYGYAVVGRVVERGAGVEDVADGELVFVHHPHQTDFVVPAEMAVPLPPEIPAEVGVLLANLETALNVMLDAHPRLGERIVVVGQGVVGLLITHLARLTGAALIVGVDPVARRRELACQMGADTAVAGGEELPEVVDELTEGVGADLVIEASGAADALQQAIRCAAFQGTVVVCSWYGTKPVSLQLGDTFHRRRLRLVSSQVSSLDPGLAPRWSLPRRRVTAVRLLGGLGGERLISHRVPFRCAADAYRLVDTAAEETVQVVLTYGDGDV